MSAYMVSKRHIDALVTAGLASRDGMTLRWLAPGEIKPTDYQRGAPWGPTASASYCERQRELRLDTATEVGRMLVLENARSVGHRYDEETQPFDYEYEKAAPALTAIETLKALDGYEYQACEHPEWGSSEAHAFCEALRKSAIGALPGYDEAEWTLR